MAHLPKPPCTRMTLRERRKAFQSAVNTKARKLHGRFLQATGGPAVRGHRLKAMQRRVLKRLQTLGDCKGVESPNAQTPSTVKLSTRARRRTNVSPSSQKEVLKSRNKSPAPMAIAAPVTRNPLQHPPHPARSACPARSARPARTALPALPALPARPFYHKANANGYGWTRDDSVFQLKLGGFATSTRIAERILAGSGGLAVDGG
ncbi:uncharacterized protein EHS24_001922 [Apiotrichum porosum]|uniref:Uncharacterized protein n=1 Tax=Apiotrichum porosum TaxID=105984 RepID=A0A427XJH7_9TREE|nr:uncharacterized protein EHS24_001922 [Apiotrichum porosum]RSH78996.1 hypothetical protein EHS24_001922 [Apiotrichum porosum]